MRKHLAILLLSLWPLGVLAQDVAPPPEAVSPEQTARDRSYLTGLIEDNLSGAGRTVILEGFAGALSSRATFTTLTIADDQGVWLTIRDGSMAWNRAAILRGEIQINELTAAEIDLPRLPVGTAADGITPEVKPFALPDLPVSVDIGTISAKKVMLGAPLLGEAVTLSLDGTLQLAGGEGQASLNVARTDGKKGKVALKGSYGNVTRQLALDLLVEEGKGGIASGMIGLPGQPAITLAVAGAGPLDDFTAGIALSTNAQPRLTGEIGLKAVSDPKAAAGTPPERQFHATLKGDIAPLLPPEYQGFFGNQVALEATGARKPSGATSLSQLRIDSEALKVSGMLDLLPSGLPERFDLSAKIGLPNGEEVLLPLSGDKTWLRAGTLALGYDKAKSDGWTLDARLTQLRRPEAEMLSLRLGGSGRIGTPSGQAPTVGGTLTLTASGVKMADPGLDAAVGPFVTGKTVFFWQQGAPLRLPSVQAIGRGYGLNGTLSIADPSGGVTVAGKVDLHYSDLSALSTLADRPLGGAIAGQISGNYTLLTGAFDTDAQVTGQDITLGQPELDSALAGQSQISLSARRDENGLTLRALNATAKALVAQASGTLNSGASNLKATAQLPDLSVLGNGLRGKIDATAQLTEADGARLISVTGTGTGLATAQPEVNRILAGQSQFELQAEERDGRIRLQNLSLKNPQVTVGAQGVIADALRRITLSARLANAALLAPGFPGPVTLDGTVTDDGKAYAVDLAGNGPGNSRATVKGQVALDFATTDLAISGSTETALINPFIAPRAVSGPLSFDLRMRGKPGLSALSGQVQANGARLIAPTLSMTLEDLAVRADLAGGRAQISTTARLGSGGQLSLTGPVSLSAPYAGDLRVVLNRARLRDPELYDTKLSGTITVNGPLTGGARISGDLVLDDTELRVPSTGLGGIAAIPEITHRNEPAAVRETRARAGLLAETDTKTGAGKAFPLDVTVSAPRQIFVRGRGLDAELGGSLRLSGTSNDIVPIGEFNLIRGRLDVLGKRFTLNEGQVALQGAMVPWILFSATTKQGDYTITLSLEGQASEPALKITSSPELPEEEVLARLLFDRGLTNLSPLQAAQLASAVASLAGKGGEGIVAKLRSGIGLDDLDIGTDAAGNATLRAGKYLSENLYSDVAVDSGGKTEINLNLDITPNLTARGSVGSDGNSGIGIFFEKDY
jgi:translocation and assembly module TamB